MTPTATDKRNGDADVEARGNGNDEPPEVTQTATGDPVPPTASPLILNDAYFDIGSPAVNLRCLVKHLEVVPENKLVTITTFCSEVDYVGVTKWHLRVTFAQSFDAGATYQTLNAAYTNWVQNGTQCPFNARPHSSQVASAVNPIISGLTVPQPFELLIGDAGTSSEVKIDWNMLTPPSVNTGAVAATGATAGAPGFFTPTGAQTPANLAALTGITAQPATAWAVGQYVITADLLANHWTGSAWAAGKA
jgi:hypothetical protein